MCSVARAEPIEHRRLVQESQLRQIANAGADCFGLRQGARLRQRQVVHLLVLILQVDCAGLLPGLRGDGMSGCAM